MLILREIKTKPIPIDYLKKFTRLWYSCSANKNLPSKELFEMVDPYFRKIVNAALGLDFNIYTMMLYSCLIDHLGYDEALPRWNSWRTSVCYSETLAIVYDAALNMLHSKKKRYKNTKVFFKIMSKAIRMIARDIIKHEKDKINYIYSEYHEERLDPDFLMLKNISKTHLDKIVLEYIYIYGSNDKFATRYIKIPRRIYVQLYKTLLERMQNLDLEN